MLSIALDTGGPQHHPFTAWQRNDLEIPVFSRFAQIAQNQAQQIAIVDDIQHWTYQQLLVLALSIAAQLEHDSQQSPVAVLLPAGAYLAAAFLASLAVGRPYVPLDPNFPTERNRLILEQSGASHIISDHRYSSLLAQISNGIDLIHIEELITSNKQPSQLNGHVKSIAYIIYTSGSTGQPKGVYQNQRGLLHDIYQFSHALHINSNDRLTWLYSPSVGGAIRDIYGALLNGATLYAINIKDVGLEGLGLLVAKANITIFHAIPPLLRAFLSSKPSYQSLSSVRLAYISGDRLFSADVDDFYRYFPRTALIYNGIGSTECATLYRHWFLHAGTLLNHAAVPVGYPIPERDVRLLDAEGRLVEIGEIGEVEVSSEFIAQGYWRNPELTAASFSVDDKLPHVRRFLTGDLARQQPDGLLEYMGRKDGQAKIRGYRIELGAIEAELRQLPQVTDAAVLINNTHQEPELVAYIVAASTNAAELRTQLQRNLPSAAIPSQFHFVDAIPRLANFKTDLAQLRANLVQNNLNSQTQSIEPTTNEAINHSLTIKITKQDLHRCWNEALHRIGDIDDEQSFVEYGGDSLKTLTLLVLLEKQLGCLLPIRLLSPEMTVNSLLRGLQLLEHDVGAKAHLYIIAGRLGVFKNLPLFSQGLSSNIFVHVVPMPNLQAELKHPFSIEELGVYVANFIINQSPIGSIHLLGFSFGARVASEAGCYLQQQGWVVENIMACDMGPAYSKRTSKKISRKTARTNKMQHLLNVIKGQESLKWQFNHWFSVDKEIWIKRMATYLPRILLKYIHIQMQHSLDHNTLTTYEKIILTTLSAKLGATWHPRYFNGVLTVFVAQHGISKMGYLPKDLGWKDFAKEVKVIELSGGHIEYMDDTGLPEFLSHINHIFSSRSMG